MPYAGTVAAWINGDGNCAGTATGTTTNPGTECWGLVYPSGQYAEISSFEMRPDDSKVAWKIVTYSDTHCNKVVDSQISGGGQLCFEPSPGAFTWTASQCSQNCQFA